MPQSTNKVVGPFDFSRASALPVQGRFEVCVELAENLVVANGYQDVSDFPCVPSGASPAELQAFVAAYPPGKLPDEYVTFLARCRYLKINDGVEVGGLSHDGLYVAERPWLSSKHRFGTEYLVFANYWRYADGDQMMFDLSDPAGSVVVYLHEHGPLFEAYAPSFSLALWRLVHEAAVD